MNSELQNALIALVITTILGGIVKLYLDYQTKLFENLWQKRFEAYSKFVKLTSLFPKYPLRKQVTWEDVHSLSLAFRDWYFEGNGIIISRRFREKYFDLQKHIGNLILTTGEKDKLKLAEKVTNKLVLGYEDYEDLRERCSKLRTLVASELETQSIPFWSRLGELKEA